MALICPGLGMQLQQPGIPHQTCRMGVHMCTLYKLSSLSHNVGALFLRRDELACAPLAYAQLPLDVGSSHTRGWSDHRGCRKSLVWMCMRWRLEEPFANAT